MIIDLGLSLIGRQGLSWTPVALGSKLKLALDPQDALTLDASAVTSGLVTSITDTVAGKVFSQATSGFKPAYGATSFVSRPGVVFDGTDDFLASDGDLGATPPADLWLLVDQMRSSAVATTDRVLTFGGTATTDRVELRRTVTGGVNRAQLIVPTAGGGVTVTNTSADFSGPCLLRLSIGAAQAFVEVNQVGMTAVAAVPTIGVTRARLASNNGSGGANFSQLAFAGAWITEALTGPDETAMYAYLNARKA